MKGTKRLFKTHLITPTLSTDIYASGDVLFATTELEDVFPQEGGHVILEQVMVVDKDDQGVEMDLVFLNRNYQLGTINDPPDITDAEADSIIGFSTLNVWEDLGGCRISKLNPILAGDVFWCNTASRSVFVSAITRGTPTHTASGLTVRISFRCEGTS